MDNILKELDEYVDNFFYGKTPDQIKYYCNRIFKFKSIENFDKYSKEILALNVEKKIINSIENSCKKIHKSSKWPELKTKAPFIYSNNSLSEYLNLFVRDFNNNNFNKNEEVEKFYNKKILIALKMFRNRLIVLPSGERISVGDIINSFQNFLNKNDIVKKEYTIKKKTGTLKKAAAISGIVTITGLTSLNMYKEIEASKTDTIVSVKEPEIFIDGEPNSSTSNIEDIEKEDNLIMSNTNIEETNKLPVFVGYDNGCPIEYQKYIYEMSIKYDVPFNILMTIVDNESAGVFNTNGKISEYDDYGLFQINICNHDLIFKELGYDSKDLLNDPYKNIEAASFLLKKICNMYNKDDYENILGTYNGWINWQSKETSRNYAINGIEKINSIYNKTNEELFEKEEDNERRK